MKSTRADANRAAAPAAKAAAKSRTVKAVTATAKAAAVPKAAAKPVPPAAAAKAANPVKSTIKSAVKGAVKSAKVPAKTAKTAAALTPAKPPKLKLVRDSFTIPSDEYEQIGELKRRALASAHPAKKSELLRAGIKLLAGLGDAALLRALKAVPAIKTGRPKLKKGD